MTGDEPGLGSAPWDRTPPPPPPPPRPRPLARLILGLRRRYGQQPPWATAVLAFALILVHALVEQLGDSEDSFHLIEMGGLQASLLWNGQAYRLVTSLFLHAGNVHFGLNLFGLVFVGLALEPRIGSVRLLSVYAAAGLVGNLAFVTLRTWQSCVGASAAIYGLFAVLVALDAGRMVGRVGPLFARRFWVLSMLIVLLDALVAMFFPIAPEAHWAGYATGALVGWALLAPTRPRLRGSVLVAIAVLCTLGSLYVLFPLKRHDYLRYRADRSFIEGAEDALGTYRKLAGQEVEGSRFRVALAEYEVNGPEAALATLDGDAVPEPSLTTLSLRVAVLDDLGRTEEADAVFEQLLDLMRSAPGSGDLVAALEANNVAMQMADHDRRLEEAELLSLGACHDLPGSVPVFIDTLGWVHARMGRGRLAQVSLLRAWKAYPIAEVAYHLAEAHYALGEMEEAERFVVRALDPDRYQLLGHPDENLLIVVRARRLHQRIREATSVPLGGS